MERRRGRGISRNINKTMVRPKRFSLGGNYGGRRMITIIFPLVTMAVGFLLGVIVTDSIGENKKINDLERKVKMLERRVDGC